MISTLSFKISSSIKFPLYSFPLSKTQFPFPFQVSSFHSDYYGEIYESPDSTSISPKMHAF